MKFIYTISLMLMLAVSVQAQKYVPQIKEGTVLNYDAYASALGRTFPVIMTMQSLGDPMLIKWNVSVLGTGTFSISAKAMQEGKKVGFKEPSADDVTKLKEDETLNFLSKSTFNDLVTNKAFKLNGQDFTVAADTTAFMINNKEADVFYAVSANGKIKMWILNNPDMPLICKLTGLRGIDLTLTGIKE